MDNEKIGDALKRALGLMNHSETHGKSDVGSNLVRPDYIERAIQHSEIMRSMEEEAAKRSGLRDASETLNLLQQQVLQFQERLDEGFEVGFLVANSGATEQLHMREISFLDPKLIVFSGVTSLGLEVVLIQHVSQLNLALIALPPVGDQQPYRIGFDTSPQKDLKP